MKKGEKHEKAARCRYLLKSPEVLEKKKLFLYSYTLVFDFFGGNFSSSGGIFFEDFGIKKFPLARGELFRPLLGVLLGLF
ncbi:MAG: hypothetical protein LBE27_01550 [Deltaproteobacteria bacterium]|jgi:hypothetical protein|nr:hypothetical protein [Deltaproteobacteria bacterium]